MKNELQWCILQREYLRKKFKLLHNNIFQYKQWYNQSYTRILTRIEESTKNRETCCWVENKDDPHVSWPNQTLKANMKFIRSISLYEMLIQLLSPKPKLRSRDDPSACDSVQTKHENWCRQQTQSIQNRESIDHIQVLLQYT